MAADEGGDLEGCHQSIRQPAVNGRRLDRHMSIALSMLQVRIRVRGLRHGVPPRRCGVEQTFCARETVNWVSSRSVPRWVTDLGRSPAARPSDRKLKRDAWSRARVRWERQSG